MRNQRGLIRHPAECLAFVCLSTVLGALAAQGQTTTANWDEFQRQVQPFLAKNCYECHGDHNPEGEVQLNAFRDSGALEKAVPTLTKAAEMLRDGKMPPKERPRPPQDQMTQVLTWLDAYAAKAESNAPRSPGHVTLHRLNRAEYNNTIRDLLALDFKPATAFPADDAGYGFDNNGDVLSIAPVLLEKYLAAAEQVLDKAIFCDPIISPPSKQWEGATMEGSIPMSDPKAGVARGNSNRIMLNGRVFNYSGEIYTEYDFPVDGQYVLRFRGYGRQRPMVQFLVDGEEVGQPVAITEDQQNSKIYGPDKVKVSAGTHRISLVFKNGATKEEYEVAAAAAAKAAEEAAAKAATQPAATMPALTQNVEENINNEDTVALAGAAPGAANAGARGRGGGRGGRGARGARGGAGAAGANQNSDAKPTMGVVYLETEGPLEITPDRMPESYRRVFIARPSATVTKSQAAEQIIRNFASKAYRRPVADDDVKPLMEIWSKFDALGEPFESSIHTALQAVLISPYFIYRYERDAEPNDSGGGVRTLDEFELASRLSYFLWSSMPDEELSALAAKGQLRANLDAQVQRMLKDPKARALADNFAGQWLKLRMMEFVNPDAKNFPDFDEVLRQAMITETQMLFLSIMQEDRSITDFIDADFTFVNERLARHYGIAGVTGDEFRRVQLAAPDRGGLLTQASILTLTSYPARTSPVQRGKWVLENLFDQAPPPPPPNVPALQEQGQLKGTLRQRMEQHRANPACANCHEQMDAIGFGLENFDAIGAWRTRDGDGVIDPTGSLPSGQQFNGPAQLKQIIRARQDEFCKTLCSRMLTYALGRGLERYDKGIVDEIGNAVKQNGYRFSVLIDQIVHSDPFQKRSMN